MNKVKPMLKRRVPLVEQEAKKRMIKKFVKDYYNEHSKAMTILSADD